MLAQRFKRERLVALRARVWKSDGTDGVRRDGTVITVPDEKPRSAKLGADYKVEPLAPGMSPDAMRAYVDRMTWYHEIEVADGVVTHGIKTLAHIQREWELFALGDLAGRSVLDIGGADGAYAFRAERDRAGGIGVLDHYLWATEPDEYATIYNDCVKAGTTPPAPHQSAAWQPDTLPARWRYDAARQALNSRAQTILADFMTCDLADVGVWDVVFYLGVLYHMEDPMRALRRVAAVTREQAIIETEAMVVPGVEKPLWHYFPRAELNHDPTVWWAPNMGALLGALGAAGFGDTEILAGEPELEDPVSGDVPRHYRAIVRAVK